MEMEVRSISVSKEVHKKYFIAPTSILFSLSYRYGKIKEYQSVEITYTPNILGNIVGILVFPIHMILEVPLRGRKDSIRMWKETFVHGFKRIEYGFRADQESFESSITFL